MDQDNELLRRFADEGSQEAFAELVRRKVDLVFAAALRQTGGDRHLAQDVTQGAFVALARGASSLAGHAVLSGWLYTTTRYLAIRAMRKQRRWQRREQEANTMNVLLREAEPGWEQLRPVIDETMHELGEQDRTALLLRFFEGRSLAEVGEATGLAENSARMRVERALEKLRGRRARRGITSTTAALGIVLANQPVVSAPTGLAASALGIALAGATSVPLAIGIMSIKKIIIGCVVAAMLGTSAYLAGRRSGAALVSEKLAALRAGSQTAVTHALLEKDEPAATVALERKGSGDGGRVAGSLRGAKGDDVDPTAPLPVNILQTLAVLHKRKVAYFSVPAFIDVAGKLSPNFREVYGLTAAQEALLQQALYRSVNRLAELEKANSTLSRDGPNGLVIAVSPFPTEGGMVYDELMQSFAETLGPERYAAFLTFSLDELVRQFGQIGTAQRTATFSINPTIPEGTPGRFSVKIKYVGPHTNGGSDRLAASLKEALDSAGTIGRLVPPDFGQ